MKKKNEIRAATNLRRPVIKPTLSCYFIIRRTLGLNFRDEDFPFPNFPAKAVADDAFRILERFSILRFRCFDAPSSPRTNSFWWVFFICENVAFRKCHVIFSRV